VLARIKHRLATDYPRIYRALRLWRLKLALLLEQRVAREGVSKEQFEKEARRRLKEFFANEERLEFNTTSSPLVSVIVVLFNRAELTLRCLQSLKQISDPPLEIVIIDNNSTDETRDLLSRVTGLRYERNADNLHFLRAANQGASLARGEYLLFLNNDTVVDPGAVTFAVESMRRRCAGAVGGRLILPSGQLQEAGNIVFRDGTCLGYGRGEIPEHASCMFERQVDYVSGAFLLTPRRFFHELGGFDESFAPAYYEETDYCLRLWERGHPVIFDPRIKTLHFEFASSTRLDALELQGQKRKMLCEKHDLQKQLPPGEVLAARTRGQSPRILFLDEQLPHVATGAGYPRANSILQIAAELGAEITLYPVCYVSPEESWERVYSDIPRQIEVMVFSGYGELGLRSFLSSRNSFYDYIVISRPNTMNLVKPFLPLTKGRVIYDAEALFSLREQRAFAVRGGKKLKDSFAKQLRKEIDLAKVAQIVTTVSDYEAGFFRDAGFTDVRVLSHGIDTRVPEKRFEDRSGVLFVGAIHDDEGPNGDSIWWFLNEILPAMRTLGFNERVSIVGVNFSKRLRLLKIDGVQLVGPVEELEPWFDSHRVFIAPTRFSAGIPAKVITAAANGLPAVTTSLLAEQLTWQNEEHLLCADRADDFARAVLRLYQDSSLWSRIQQKALSRTREQFSLEQFRQTVKQLFS
jgi:GT2 family glycosyltransferase